MTSELRLIPLDALRVSPFNLRAPDDGTPEFNQLLASIEANGLLEPLVVEPARLDNPAGDRVGEAEPGSDQPLYEVLQGGHRLLALRRLQDLNGQSGGTAPCQLLSGLSEAEAREVALATTVIRRPTHPVDEYEAFARLSAEGLDAAAIARRFGISERGVKQRLALGGLCPEARLRWRAGELDFDAAAALTQAGDFERQMIALSAISRERQSWWSARDVTRTIRRVLAEGRVRADQSGEWRYAEAEYRAAGGAVSEDLFSDEIMIENVPLLKQVAKAKALAEGEAFQKEHGFGACFFFEDGNAKSAFEVTEIDIGEFEPLPEEKAELDRLQAAFDALPGWNDLDGIEDEAARKAATARRNADEQRLSDEQEQAHVRMELRLFKQEVDCTRHAVGVRIRADGELDVSFGYVIPGMGEAASDDEPERKRLPTTQDPAKAAPAPEPKGLGDAHKAELAALMSRACALAIEAQPDLALPVLLASLWTKAGTTVPLEFNGLHRLRQDGFIFGQELRTLHHISEEQQIDFLAELVAKLVSLGSWAIEKREHAAFIALIEEEAAEFQSTLRALFDPGEFFARAPREIMEQAAGELAIEGYRAAAPKKDMLPLVTAEARRRGWLPQILRTEKYALLPADAAPEKPATGGKGGKPRSGKPRPEKPPISPAAARELAEARRAAARKPRPVVPATAAVRARKRRERAEAASQETSA